MPKVKVNTPGSHSLPILCISSPPSHRKKFDPVKKALKRAGRPPKPRKERMGTSRKNYRKTYQQEALDKAIEDYTSGGRGQFVEIIACV